MTFKSKSFKVKAVQYDGSKISRAKIVKMTGYRRIDVDDGGGMKLYGYEGGGVWVNVGDWVVGASNKIDIYSDKVFKERFVKLDE